MRADEQLLGTHPLCHAGSRSVAASRSLVLAIVAWSVTWQLVLRSARLLQRLFCRESPLVQRILVRATTASVVAFTVPVPSTHESPPPLDQHRGSATR